MSTAADRIGIEVRLWAGVDRRGPDDCWPWQRATRKGYGTIKVEAGELGVEKKRDMYAHRVVFRVVHGRWPEPIARHTCDNPPCCNPAHVIEGTAAQNMRDKYERGRACHPPGELSARAVVPNAVVREARERYAQGGILQRELASIYGVAQTTVSRWVRGVRYRGVS